MKTFNLKLMLIIALSLFISTPAIYSQETVEVQSVSKDNPTLRKLSDAQFNKLNNNSLKPNVIRVFSGEKKQEIMGMGGAMTQSSAYLLSTLPQKKQDEIINAFYGENGSQYSLMRTHIGSCDFSLRTYDYDSTPNDWDLKHFSIAEDEKYIIPAIQKAFALNPDIKLFAAPWSPPAWMKKSGNRFGKGLGSIAFRNNALREDCYDVYARYLAEYVKAFKRHGIDVFSVSVQNEIQNNSPWESCTYSIGQTINFVGDHLGPVFKREGLDSRIIIWDWDKQNDIVHGDGMDKFCFDVIKNPAASRYIWGVGYHWYGFDLGSAINNDDVWSLVEFPFIDYLKYRFPQKHYIGTEAAAGGFIDMKKKPWTPAARCIFDVINDFAHNTEGWIGWNMILTTEGGPNHTSPDTTKSGCRAPILIDPKTKEIIYTPAYYAMKLFSRKLRPGGRVVNSEFNTWSPNCWAYLNQVTVQNPDGTTTVIIGNFLNEKFDISIMDGDNVLNYTLDPNSLTTFTYKNTSNERDDLAEAKYCYSSSVENGYNPSHSTDNNLDTRWASDWSDDQWLEINLVEKQTVNSISSLWQNGASNDYKVEYKASDGSWKEVSYINRFKTTAMLNIEGPWPWYNRYYDVKSSEIKSRKVPLKIDFFKPVNTSSIRIHGVKRNENYGYSIFQVKVSGPKEVGLLYKDDFTAYASSTQSVYSPDLVFDGNGGSRWGSDWSDNQSITFDAGKTCHFANLTMKFENARNCEFEIQISNDNKNFTTIPYQLERFYEYTNVKLNPQVATARYLRFQGIHKHTLYGYSIYNVSISGSYGDKSADLKDLNAKQSIFQSQTPKDKLTIYPNPTNNQNLIIYSDRYLGNGTIYSIQGEKIKTLFINNGLNQYYLGLNPGIYLLKRPNENNVEKIIVK